MLLPSCRKVERKPFSEAEPGPEEAAPASRLHAFVGQCLVCLMVLGLSRILQPFVFYRQKDESVLVEKTAV